MKKKVPSSLRKKSFDGYIKYSGLAFQMIATLLLGVFGGMKLDSVLKLSFPLFTLLLTLLGLGASLYLVIKDVLKK